MKTFRLVSAALFAVLMCANFASCSKDDDGANTDVGGGEEGGNEEVIVNEKKLVKLVCKDDVWDSTYTLSYDSEGRLQTTSYYETDGEYNTFSNNRKFIWGDNAIKVITKYDNGEEHSYTFTLTNGLVRTCEDSETFSYNSSNRLTRIDFEDDNYDYRTEAIWDKDKLVSVVDYYNGKTDYDTTFTYGTTCKKGYYPLIPEPIYWDMLFVAHPEIAGMRTTQLPTTYTERDNYSNDIESANISYEFDKEGYISKIKYEYEDGNVATYTLTWK